MENFERYLKIKELFKGRAGRAVQLEGELVAMIKEEKGLDERALRAEALGEKGAENLKKMVGACRERIQAMKDEVQRERRAFEVLEEEKKKIRPAALEEIRQMYRGPFDKALRFAYMKLQEAAEAEREVGRIEEAAQAAVSQIECDPALSALPIVDRVLVDKKGQRGELTNLIDLFLRDCRNQGVQLE